MRILLHQMYHVALKIQVRLLKKRIYSLQFNRRNLKLSMDNTSKYKDEPQSDRNSKISENDSKRREALPGKPNNPPSSTCLFDRDSETLENKIQLASQLAVPIQARKFEFIGVYCYPRKPGAFSAFCSEDAPMPRDHHLPSNNHILR